MICVIEKGEKLMLNNISFMGREECLNVALNKADDVAKAYFKPGTPVENLVKPLEDSSKAASEKLNAAIKAKYLPHSLPENEKVFQLSAEESYRISHGK